MRTRILFLMFVSAASIQVDAQESKVDSLLSQLPHASDKGLIYKHLVYELADVDNPRAYQFCLRYYDLRLQAGDTAEIVHAGRVLGQLLRRLEKFDSSKIILLKMLPIARRHKLEEERTIILKALSITYTMGAQYDKALSCLMECLRILFFHDDPILASEIYHQMGFIYYKLSNYNKGIEYGNKSLALKQQNNYGDAYESIQLNISLCYIYMGEFNEATKIIEDVRKKITTDQHRLLMQLEYTLAEFSLHSGDTSDAKLHFVNRCNWPNVVTIADLN